MINHRGFYSLISTTFSGMDYVMSYFLTANKSKPNLNEYIFNTDAKLDYIYCFIVIVAPNQTWLPHPHWVEKWRKYFISKSLS